MNSFKGIFLMACVSLALCAPHAHQGGNHKHKAHKKTAAPYHFTYGVHDPETNDVKAQEETSDGHVIKGSYTVREADGSHRIVEYTADEKNGFRAVVKIVGKDVHVVTHGHKEHDHKKEETHNDETHEGNNKNVHVEEDSHKEELHEAHSHQEHHHEEVSHEEESHGEHHHEEASHEEHHDEEESHEDHHHEEDSHKKHHHGEGSHDEHHHKEESHEEHQHEEDSHDEHEHHEHHHEDGSHDEHEDQPYSKYNFSYGVHDPNSGDIKSHNEENDGNTVKGSYTIKEADGTTRVVEYTADKHSGFKAVVKKIGHAKHPKKSNEEKHKDE